ncbi:hypothetical protein MRX96_004088 [Rhipicephalus microplus]
MTSPRRVPLEERIGAAPSALICTAQRQSAGPTEFSHTQLCRPSVNDPVAPASMRRSPYTDAFVETSWPCAPEDRRRPRRQSRGCANWETRTINSAQSARTPDGRPRSARETPFN